MSPLRCIQFTGSQWIVILEEVSLVVLTEVGGADGTKENILFKHLTIHKKINVTSPSPASPVTAVTGTLTALPAALVAVTVMV